MRRYILFFAALCAVPVFAADPAPRAREIGIPFDGTPGPLNAITDVGGVTVGQVTLIRDLPDGHAVRTGVTAVVPRGPDSKDANVYAGYSPLNGNGEMTGTIWVEEGGLLEGPVMITNTHSIGAVDEGTIRWRVAQGGADYSGYFWSAPIVAETWDGYLNDINGFHVRPEHAGAALDAARGGPVAEGSVGGGTGMICFEFKCGIGTASRIVTVDDAAYTVGVLVQSNFGIRSDLRIAGVPVGVHMPGNLVWSRADGEEHMQGSIIAVVATDAPLLPHQLKRIARRVTLGIGRLGDVGYNGSGDIFIAFSTANRDAAMGEPDAVIRSVPNDSLDPLFAGTVQATEEAIVNALVAGRDMTGEAGHTVKGIDIDRLRDLLRASGRLVE
ncbi:MAG: P1 family peptidase [Woeseiaceae bacterium]